MSREPETAGLEHGWIIRRKARDPAEDQFYESLFALTNGRIGLRSTFDYEAPTSQPGFFHFDGYGPGLTVPSNLLNLFNPCWWRLQVDGDMVDGSMATTFEQKLDMADASTGWTAIFEDAKGRLTKVARRWFLPAGQPEQIAVRTVLTSLNHDDTITFFSGFDWRHGNGDFGGVHPDIRVRGFVVDQHEVRGARLCVGGRVNGHRTGFRAALDIGSNREWQSYRERDIGALSTRFTGNATIDAIVTIGTDCIPNLHDGFDNLQIKHRRIWADRWGRAVELAGPLSDVTAMRFAQFQVFQCPDRFSRSTNVAARGLTSEYHSGHFFFNTDLYLLPWFALAEPDVARSLLRHRINTLDAAKTFARESGFAGARFPEEADRDGRPAAPSFIRDIFTGATAEEESGRLVYHLSACVLFSLATFLNRTGDATFLREECIPLVAETAAYLLSLVPYDAGVKGRGAKAVMCFDEFHYPVDHHTATNAMAKWALTWAAETLDRLERSDPDIAAELMALGATPEARLTWRAASEEIHVPSPDADRVVPLFEGYFDLPDSLRLDDPDGKFPILRPEEQEKASRLEAFTTRLCKQADVLMLFTMFPHLVDQATLKACLAFYEPRTMHASSLSTSPHAVAAGWCGEPELLRDLTMKSARYNLDFSPRENYGNGIHFGAYAGALLALLHGAIGLSGEGENLTLKPCLPDSWEQIMVPFYWKGSDLLVVATRSAVTVRHRGGGGGIRLHVHDQQVLLPIGHFHTFKIS